jgi:hypothetical protein
MSAMDGMGSRPYLPTRARQMSSLSSGSPRGPSSCNERSVTGALIRTLRQLRVMGSDTDHITTYLATIRAGNVRSCDLSRPFVDGAFLLRATPSPARTTVSTTEAAIQATGPDLFPPISSAAPAMVGEGVAPVASSMIVSIREVARCQASHRSGSTPDPTPPGCTTYAGISSEDG